ncbi:MAG: hypothetical protein AABX66_01635 [Nanoarchaeota archaeon]
MKKPGSLKKIFKEHISKHAVNYMIAILGLGMYSPIIIAGYYQQKIQNLGEEFQMLKIGGQTRYSYHNRCFIDFKSDGNLDQSCRSMPVSPFMGGPRYMLMNIPITDEDRTNFQRAKRLEAMLKK